VEERVAVDPEAVREQVGRIVSSPEFAASPRLCEFLTFVTELQLSGRGDTIKEYVIGVEVYRKGDGYDPRSDPTVRVDAGKLRAGNRDQNRPRPDRNNQSIVALDGARMRAHRPRVTIDGDDGLASAQIDMVSYVPVLMMNDDVIELLLAGEHGRQHDAVIVDARLGAEDGDVVAIWRARKQLLEQSAGRHAVAENDEPLSGRTSERHLPSRTPIDSDRKRGLARLCSDGSTARVDTPRRAERRAFPYPRPPLAVVIPVGCSRRWPADILAIGMPIAAAAPTIPCGSHRK